MIMKIYILQIKHALFIYQSQITIKVSEKQGGKNGSDLGSGNIY